VEVTRDIAGKFNQTYGETFVIPEPRIRDSVAAVPGTDGQKMSKSYDNTIEIFGEEKPLRKKVMRLVMDSRPPEDPKPDADKNIAIQLLKLFTSAEVASETENKLREGGLGYGDLKKTLFEHYWEYFTEARAKRSELENNLDYVNQVLRESAKKARALASTVVDRAKKNCGLS
jgi:tryptophanyl-tRNA synthetase